MQIGLGYGDVVELSVRTIPPLPSHSLKVGNSTVPSEANSETNCVLLSVMSYSKISKLFSIPLSMLLLKSLVLKNGILF